MEFVKLLMTRIARLVSCATPPLPHSPLCQLELKQRQLKHLSWHARRAKRPLNQPPSASIAQPLSRKTYIIYALPLPGAPQPERERESEGGGESKECIANAWTHGADINVFVHLKLDDGQQDLLLKILSHLTTPLLLFPTFPRSPRLPQKCQKTHKTLQLFKRAARAAS